MTRLLRAAESMWRRIAVLGTAFTLLAVPFSQGDAVSQEGEDAGKIVRGEVVLDSSTPAFKDATLHVYLEEVTELDTQANVIAHLIINKVSGGGPRGGPIRFTFGVLTPAEDACYNVRAHVVVNGGNKLQYEKINKGDFISLAKFPVLTGDDRGRVRVKVQLIP